MLLAAGAGAVAVANDRRDSFRRTVAGLQKCIVASELEANVIIIIVIILNPCSFFCRKPARGRRLTFTAVVAILFCRGIYIINVLN